MQNVSQHSKSLEKTGGGDMQQQLKDDADNKSFSANTWKSSRKRKEEEVVEQGGDDGKEDTSSLKKPRLAWSIKLHQQFIDAVNQLGIDKAVPKKILEMMNEPGITRENVASHLQKYRIHLRRHRGDQGHTNHLFATAQDPNVGLVSTLNGFNLQAFAVEGQPPSQSLGWPSSVLTKPGMSVSPLVDQRSVFNFENPKIKFGHGHEQRMNSGGNKEMTLLHGVPMGHMPVGGGPSMLPPSLGQQQQMFSRRSDLTDAVAVRNSIQETRSSRVLPDTHSVFNNSLLDVHRNRFPLASAHGISVPYQEEILTSSLSAATVTTTGFGPNNWVLPSTGMFFNSHQVTSAGAASVEAYLSSSTQRKRMEANHVQSHQQQQPALNHMNQVYMNGGSVGVKSERVVETETCPPTTTLFDEQEDLMSALLNFDGYSIDNIPV